MSARSRLLPSKDEELGKRDDDFRPRISRTSSMTSVLPWRWRKRRALLLLVFVVLLYIWVRHIPTDFEGINQRVGSEYEDNPYAEMMYREPSGPPPRESTVGQDETQEHYYNGVVRFYKLGKSLHRIARTMGSMISNRNVLFAASSTKSAANLIPIACEMAKVDRNFAHLALFGRSTIPLSDILMLNGVDENDCRVFFHDARGDYAEYSTEARLEAAMQGAMKHINDYMHPQVILVDDSDNEDGAFTNSLRKSAKTLSTPLVEVPSGRYEDWLWITRLDAHSLANWYTPNVEILIQAPTGSSGGLIRLLRSLATADYQGLKVPGITIELPSDIEDFLQKYLSDFKWPPGRDALQSSSLKLRHRVSNSRISSEQASIRFTEMFYPSNKDNSYVLVLSPHVEVSPVYLQYLQLNILEYRTKVFGWSIAEDMLGLSLDIPNFLVDGKTAFEHPTIANTSYNRFSGKPGVDEEDHAPFLYQGLSSTATLFFGEKWATFHDFLTKRIQASHSGKKGKTGKIVAETEPAWVEFVVELMRARGWSILHPSSSFVTVHNDLAQVPEEYARLPATDTKQAEALISPEEEPFVLSAEPPVLVEHPESDDARTQMPLHQMLPFNGELLSFSDLPLISHDGKPISIFDRGERAHDYATWFRAAIGGCQGDQASRSRVKKDLKTDDLFCLPGVDLQFDDEDDFDAEADWSESSAESIMDSTNSDMESDSTESTDTTEEVTHMAAKVETVGEAQSAGSETDSI